MQFRTRATQGQFLRSAERQRPRSLRENLWLSGKPSCASLFPLLTSEHTADVIIENITLDGNRENCENFNGNYGGCIFLQDCNRYTFHGVTARNYNGDGISFQICHDVVVENCHNRDNTDLGVHPGSGSQRPIIRGNTLERNSQGLFWCWGVKYGLAENNIIENSGDEDGVGIEVTGETKDIRIVGNTISETRGPGRRIGIRIGEKVGKVDLIDNKISGVATPIDRLQKERA